MAAVRASEIGMFFGFLAACCLPVGCQPKAPPATAGPDAIRPSVPKPDDEAGRPLAATRPALPARALTPFDKLAPAVKTPVNVGRPGPIPPRAKKLVVDGYKLILRGDFAGAVTLLERAKGYDPRNVRIRRALGLAYFGLPDFGRAEESLRLAAKQTPDDLEVQLRLGGLAFRNKQNDEAIIALRTALKCSAAKPSRPLAAQALLRLGEVLEREGYLTAAVECYTRLGKWVGRHGGAYAKHKALRPMVLRPELLLTRRGALLKKLRRSEESIRLLERSYRLNRTDLRTAELLVRSLLEAGHFDRAEKLLLSMAGEPTQSRQVPALVQAMIATTGDKKLPLKIYRAAGRRAENTLGVALARLAERLGDREQAGEILQALLEARPDSPEAAARLAHLYAGQGKVEAGLRILVRVLAASPSAAPAVRAGIDEVSSGEVPRGLERRLAASADANDSKEKFALHYVAGRLAQLRGGADFAAAQYRKAFRAKKDFLPAYAALMQIHLAGKQLDRAAEVLRAAREAAGDSYFVDYLRGRLELARGNISESLTALLRARRRNSLHLPTLMALAEAHARNGQTVDSMSVLLAARRLRPGDAGIARKLFDLYVARGEYPRAERIVGWLLRARPGSPQGRLMRARLLLETGKFRQARQVLELLARQAPDDPDVVLLQLRAEMGADKTFPTRKEFDDLTKRLGEALRDRPGNLEARRMLAELYTRAGKDADAARMWKEVHDDSPDDSAAARRCGESLLRSGQYAPAAEVLKRRLADSPNDLGLRRKLIETLTQLKKFDEAETFLKKWTAEARDYQKLRYRLELQELYEVAKSYGKLQKFLDEWMKADRPGTSKRALRARKVQVFALAGELDRAVGYTSKWLEDSPGDTIAKEVLIEALLEQGAFDKAKPLLDKWLGGAEGKELERLRRLKIIGHWKAKQIDQAEKVAFDLIRIQKSPTEAMRVRKLLVAVLVDQEKFDRAASLLAGWIKDGAPPPAKDEAPTRPAKGPEAATRPASTTQPAKPARPAPRPRPVPATGPAAQSQPGRTARPAGAKPSASRPSRRKQPATATAPAARRRMSPEALRWCRQMHVVVLVMRQKYKEALKLAETYLRGDPGNADLLDQISTCMTELGRHAEALAALANSHRLRRRRLEEARASRSVQAIAAAAASVTSAANNLAYMYADHGLELKRAEKLALTAVRARPIPAFIDTLGWVYYKQNKLSRAGTIFLELLRKPEGAPGLHPVMLDHAGDVYYRLGWKQRASGHWRRALVEAGKGKRRTAEIRLILSNTPKKVRAVKKGKTPPVAPLGKGVKDELLK